MKVIPGTVSDEATIEALIAIGVDGVIADLADLGRHIMAEHGFKLPRPTSRTASSRPDPGRTRAAGVVEPSGWMWLASTVAMANTFLTGHGGNPRSPLGFAWQSSGCCILDT